MTNPLQALFPEPSPANLTPTWPNDSADRGYTIFFTGRCGSTDLIDVLSQTGICGVPDEFFNEEFVPHHNADWQSKDLASYIANLVAHRSAGRMFGFKIDGFRHRYLCNSIDPLRYFPKSSFSYLYMTRRGVLEQAYSYAHAKKTGIWHSVGSDDQVRSSAAPDVSDSNLWHEIALILEQEFYFERYFIENSLRVLRIDYEMLCASRHLLAAEVMLYLGLPPDLVSNSVGALSENYRKLKYDPSKMSHLIEFRARYEGLLAHLISHRGRIPFTAVRTFVGTHAGQHLTQWDD